MTAVDALPPLPEERWVHCVKRYPGTNVACGARFRQTVIPIPGVGVGATPLGHLWTPPDCGAHDEAAIAARRSERAALEQSASSETEDDSARIVQLIEALDTPLEYRDATLTTPILYGSPVQRERTRALRDAGVDFVTEWPRRLDPEEEFPRLTILRGASGTSKTLWLYAVAHALIASHRARCRVAVLQDLILELRASWRDPRARSEAAVLHDLRSVDFLAIDEVSSHALLGEPGTHLYGILAHRMKWLRPTVLTTNDDNDTLATIIGPALVDRAAGSGGIIETGTESYRMARRKARRRS